MWRMSRNGERCFWPVLGCRVWRCRWSAVCGLRSAACGGGVLLGWGWLVVGCGGEPSGRYIFGLLVWASGFSGVVGGLVVGVVGAEVVVVGGGPVGLLVACELAGFGVDVVVVEVRGGVSGRPKATTLHARTVQVLARRGYLGVVEGAGPGVRAGSGPGVRAGSGPGVRAGSGPGVGSGPGSGVGVGPVGVGGPAGGPGVGVGSGSGPGGGSGSGPGGGSGSGPGGGSGSGLGGGSGSGLGGGSGGGVGVGGVFFILGGWGGW
ncbi:FAD-dependent monooxygenase [Streptomyces sp. NBC_00080]|uniref:FAD-dependent monooxygenase n=1 Tax=Streptomyces sp. NBC_00080 TaxID=2975645 RepID=UPI003870DE7A